MRSALTIELIHEGASGWTVDVYQGSQRFTFRGPYRDRGEALIECARLRQSFPTARPQGWTLTEIPAVTEDAHA